MTNCLRASLFPRVPPYLKFIGHEESPCLKIPLPIQKHLKWKLTTITPIVVKKTLTNSGFRLVKSECDTAECPQEGKNILNVIFRLLEIVEVGREREIREVLRESLLHVPFFNLHLLAIFIACRPCRRL